MRRLCLAAAFAAPLMTAPVGTNAADTHGVCVENKTSDTMYFVAQSKTGARKTAWLQSGQRLCSPTSSAQAGVVSVFAGRDVQEGCSRLAGVDQTETLLDYVNIDRCLWADQN